MNWRKSDWNRWLAKKQKFKLLFERLLNHPPKIFYLFFFVDDRQLIFINFDWQTKLLKK